MIKSGVISMKPGDIAPDFSGLAIVKKEIKTIQLKDFRGKYCILFFYPSDL